MKEASTNKIKGQLKQIFGLKCLAEHVFIQILDQSFTSATTHVVLQQFVTIFILHLEIHERRLVDTYYVSLSFYDQLLSSVFHKTYTLF